MLGSSRVARAEEVAEAPAEATEDTRPLTPEVALRHRWAVDVPVTLGLAAVAVTGAVLHDELSPSSCVVCDGAEPGASNAIDQGVRDALVRPDTTPARTTSHVLAFGVAPLFALSLEALAAVADRRREEIAVDVLVVAQATAAAAALDQGLGLALARERPRHHVAARADDTIPGAAGPEGLGSLPSSHTTLAFALAASSGTVASLRGYRLAPLVWGSGVALGLATAYTRVASDDAWLTDTLVGAGLGTAVGVLVPLLFHGPEGAPRFGVSVREIPGGRLGAVSVAF